MKAFKNLTLPYILLNILLIFCMTGCVGGLKIQSSPTDAVTATSEIVLSLSTPKTVYTVGDSIKLNLSIQNGQFNLLVPSVNVATPGAFKRLKVKDTDGNITEPERPIRVPISEDIFIERNGKSVQCIQGLELKAESTHEISLENLRKYYELQKGSYAVTLTITVPIYRDSLKKRHPEIIELEEEIKRIKKVADAHVSAADKRSAVNDLQQQIESLEKKHKYLYLPVKSLLGEASITSNALMLTIE